MWIESFGLWRVQVSSWSSEYMMSISPLFLSDIIRIFCCFSLNFWQVCQLHPQKKHSNIIKDHKHIYSQRSLQFILIKYATKSFQSTETVPESNERKSKKETEGPPDFCHQGGAWVDQLLRFNSCLGRDGPEGEYRMFRFKGWTNWFSQEFVFFVLAWFWATSNLADFSQFGGQQFVKNLVIFPAKKALKFILSVNMVGGSIILNKCQVDT